MTVDAVKFLRLRGGDANGDFAGVPASQPDVVRTFLDPPGPETST